AQQKDRLCGGGPASVGTGPFTFASYTKGHSAVFARNPGYAWGPPTAQHSGAANLSKLVVRFLPENSVRVGALRSGQADVIDDVPAVSVAALKATSVILRQNSPGATYNYYLNTTRP